MLSKHYSVIAGSVGVVALAVFALLQPLGFFLSNVPQNGQTNRAQLSTSSSENVNLFKEMLLFDGRTADGFPVTTQTYRSWDCVILRKRVEVLRSIDQAKSRFKREVGKAGVLIEGGLRPHSTGQPVGERAVFRLAEKGELPQTYIFWTHGSDLISIESPSLEHALKLEAWLKSGQSRPAPTPDRVTNNLVFELTSSTNGTTNKGIPFSERLFRSNECVILSSRIEYFGSATDASKELALKLKDAIEIVANGSTGALNNRTVAIFAPELPTEFSHSAQVLWTDNGELHTIKSSSLPHTLSFESQRK